jgi:hypothetical protein
MKTKLKPDWEKLRNEAQTEMRECLQRGDVERAFQWHAQLMEAECELEEESEASR